MNVFTWIINQAGVSEHSFGLHGWFYALLKACAYDYEGENTHVNPVTEAARRLELMGVGSNTLTRFRQLTNTLESAFNAGLIK